MDESQLLGNIITSKDIDDITLELTAAQMSYEDKIAGPDFGDKATLEYAAKIRRIVELRHKLYDLRGKINE